GACTVVVEAGLSAFGVRGSRRDEGVEFPRRGLLGSGFPGGGLTELAASPTDPGWTASVPDAKRIEES
ncbi:MAG: hypothetical protein ACK53L_12885, partial [Pirellulaceae bacterium]